MRIILGSTASDDASEIACDYAVIELSRDAAQKILARMDALTMLYSRDRSLHEFHFFDAEIRFFQRKLDDDVNACLPSDASQYVVVADPGATTNGAPLSTECEHMVVAINGPEPEVYWRARAKHSPLRMETCALPQSEIARLVNGVRVTDRQH